MAPLADGLSAGFPAAECACHAALRDVDVFPTVVYLKWFLASE